MILWCSTFLLIHPVMLLNYKVGLILKLNEETSALAQFMLEKLDTSETSIQIEVEYHDYDYLSVVDAICALLEKGVVAIIAVSDSTLTSLEVNILNQFHVPLIAGIATNPFLRSHSEYGLILLTPSDVYQSQAIFDILKEYHWYEFSILASADEYGINGVLNLQNLAIQDGSFRMKHVQYFETYNDVEQDKHYFEKLLTQIRESLTKVIVLNCKAIYAKSIFR